MTAGPSQGFSTLDYGAIWVESDLCINLAQWRGSWELGVHDACRQLMHLQHFYSHLYEQGRVA